jgi:hypothetical protein
VRRARREGAVAGPQAGAVWRGFAIGLIASWSRRGRRAWGAMVAACDHRHPRTSAARRAEPAAPTRNGSCRLGGVQNYTTVPIWALGRWSREPCRRVVNPRQRFVRCGQCGWHSPNRNSSRCDGRSRDLGTSLGGNRPLVRAPCKPASKKSRTKNPEGPKI